MSKSKEELRRLTQQLKDPNYIARLAQERGLKLQQPERKTFKPPALEGLNVDIPEDAELTPKALKDILVKVIAGLTSHVDKAVGELYKFSQDEKAEEETARRTNAERAKINEFRAKHPDFEEHLDEISRQYKANGGDVEAAYKAAKKLADKGKDDEEEEEDEGDDDTNKEGADGKPPKLKRTPVSLDSEGGDHEPSEKIRRKPKEGSTTDIIGTRVDQLFTEKDFQSED